MTKYTEIFRLRDMLDSTNIAYTFQNRSLSLPNLERESYQITVYHDENRVISVIQGLYTYGAEANLLEIMGLLTPEEEASDSVAGGLTAENVFERIQKWFSSN